MRTIVRTMAVTAASAALLLTAQGTALAAEPDDISFSFAVDGSSVVNTITNNSDATVFCGTALAAAPEGVLPPVGEVLQNGQTLATNGDAQPGSTTQTVTDIPDGSYVVLASCTVTEGSTTTAWISDYPGLDEYLTDIPWTSHTVEQASTVVTIGGAAATPDVLTLPGLGPIVLPCIGCMQMPDLTDFIGSGSAG